MKKYIYLFILVLFSFSCSTYKAKTLELPNKVDTTTKPTQKQEYKTFSIDQLNIYADNQFDASRLNGFEYVNDSLIRATILPENEPINPSPYYAFQIWSDQEQTITLELNYPVSKHRYYPKISTDKKNWTLIDSSRFWLAADSVNAYLKLDLSREKIYVSAQEIEGSKEVKEWCDLQAQHPDVSYSVIGKSQEGRDLMQLEIGQPPFKKKNAVLIISRQHPPEVTGYLAMKAFVETLLEDTPLSNAFRAKFRILVIPLVNPDGVDLGHWRHSTAGIDLNRDWAYYNQVEVRTVANHFVKTLKKNKNKALLGLDFHSTYEDVFYTPTADEVSVIAGFKNYWLQGIGDALDGYETNDAPGKNTSPTSKTWFLKQLGAEGITYEIGDNTDRAFIKEKGRVSALEMMKLLILKD